MAKEKPLKPTAKRIKKAKEQGQILKSSIITACCGAHGNLCWDFS